MPQLCCHEFFCRTKINNHSILMSSNLQSQDYLSFFQLSVTLLYTKVRDISTFSQSKKSHYHHTSIRSQKKLKWSRLNPPQFMYPLALDHIFIMKSVWQFNKTLNGYTRTLWTIIVIVLSLEYRKWCRYFSTFIHQCYCRDSNEFLFISIWHLHKWE